MLFTFETTASSVSLTAVDDERFSGYLQLSQSPEGVYRVTLQKSLNLNVINPRASPVSGPENEKKCKKLNGILTVILV